MTRVRNMILNYIALAVVLLSCIILRMYTNFHYLQVVQGASLFLILASGLTMVINNFVYLKQVKKNYISVIFICLGSISIIYSVLILYLVFSLRNIGF